MEFNLKLKYIFLISFINCILGQNSLDDLITLGEKCVIQEPLYKTVLNFNVLHSELGHSIGHRKDHFSFNVCGKLNKSCAGKDNIGACLTRGDKEYVLGYNDSLMIQNGMIQFHFEGEDCNSESKYILTVLPKCIHATVKDPITVTEYADKECHFYIHWRTSQACLMDGIEFVDDFCEVSDDVGNKYDLSSLHDPFSNYKVPTRNSNSNGYFIINICRPLIYGQHEMCPSDSSVCFINNTLSNTKFINYGSTTSKLIYENNQIKMRLNSSESCNSSSNFYSTIIFGCDLLAKIGRPEYLGKSGCEYKFSWQTDAVCEKRVPCVVNDPITGFQYNMTSLSNKKYSTKLGNSTYFFGICKSPNDPCLGSSGACEVSNGQSMAIGIVNSDLRFNTTGSPYLLYTSGAVCKDISRKWMTKIEFVCSTDKLATEPKIIENTECIVIIQVVTKLACTKDILCRVYNFTDDTEIDLAPLISSTHNYVARVNDTLVKTQGFPVEFHINVCRPLVPQFGLSCAGGSAACKSIKENNKPEHEQSLGYADISLTLVDTLKGSRVQLKYLRGDKCPEDSTSEMSSLIEFYCDPKAGYGTPILQTVNECDYIFDWPTDVICPLHKCEYKKDTCTLYNEQLDISLNLKNISNNGLLNVHVDTKNVGITVCPQSAAATTDYKQNAITMFYSIINPDDENGTINIDLRLECSETTRNFSIIDNINKETWNLVLTIDSPLVCPIVGVQLVETTTVAQPQTDASQNSNNGNKVPPVASAIGVTIAFLALLGFVIGLIYFFKKSDNRSKIKYIFIKRTDLGNESDDELLI